MAKFLTGNELNAELEKIFERADEQLILISPFIKLHDRYLSSLRTKKDNHKLEIIVIFGKNEYNPNRSMRSDDLSFFKEFPNIQIKYEKRLHAKYYANETSAILTSMNLYSFSQDNNIEAGVMTKATLLGNLAKNYLTNVPEEDSFDIPALNYFKRVIEQSELLFHKKPQFENIQSEFKYKESKIEIDGLSEFFSIKPKSETHSEKEFVTKKGDVPQKEIQKTNKSKEATEHGHCIRCDKSIELKPLAPYCKDCYNVWKNYEDEKYEEKFCHICGKDEKTTKAKPSCYNCYKSNKNKFEFPLTS